MEVRRRNRLRRLGKTSCTAAVAFGVLWTIVSPCATGAQFPDSSGGAATAKGAGITQAKVALPGGWGEAFGPAAKWGPAKQSYTVGDFYRGILSPSGMVALSNDVVIAVQGSGEEPGLLRCSRNGRYKPEDVFSGIGGLYQRPEGLVRLSDGRFVVSDLLSGILEVPSFGGPPSLLLTEYDCYGNPAQAPAGFDGTNADPGDVIIPDSFATQIGALNPTTRALKVLVPSSFFPGPWISSLEFGPDNMLYAVWSDYWGSQAQPRIYRFDAEGNGEDFFQFTDFDYNQSDRPLIEIDALGQWLYFTHAPMPPSPYSGKGTIFRISLARPKAGPELVVDLGVECNGIELCPYGSRLFCACAMGIKEVVLDAADSDNDGLPDNWESANGLDSAEPDTDRDGMPDGWEQDHGLAANDDTGVNGADGDPDYDFLPNLGEFSAGTDPNDSDTDRDGLTDGYEADLDGDPAKFDTDGDGASDRAEVLAGTALNDAGSVPVWYVDQKNVSGLEYGTSWSTAFTTIQQAADAGGGEVWVAEGVYAESVAMKNGVRLYGGFTGVEKQTVQRDYVAHPTIIDASTVNGGGPAEHVVMLDRTTQTRLDGFVIQGGGASASAKAASFGDYGAGICAVGADSSNSVVNCAIVSNNQAYYYGSGGGVACILGSDLSIIHCTITANFAYSGGGLLCQDSSPRVYDSMISGNGAGFLGGGILYIGMGNPTGGTVANCIISGNEAGYGGGVACEQNASPSLVNCTICNNTAAAGGGVLCGLPGYAFEPHPAIINVLLAENAGYAMYEASATTDPAVSHCLFFNNPDGDYLDEGATVYTGAPAINFYVDRADRCVDGNPLFRMGAAGTWTGLPDPGFDRTWLVDEAAAFVPGALVGKLINPNISQHVQALIIANTATMIEVVGDVSGIANFGDTYQIIDYHLQDQSAALDRGVMSVPDTDFEGDARPGLDGLVDIGLDEADPAFQPSMDSDRDGLSDFDEVNLYHTNPADPDSDRDGVSDGIEVLRGTNPNDPNDFPRLIVGGRVVDAHSGLPLADVAVNLFDAAGNYIISTITDGAGLYSTFAPDAPALLRVTFTKDGYDRTERAGFAAPATVDATLMPASPLPPYDLGARPGPGHVLLRWRASPDYDVIGYNVYRSWGLPGSPVLLNTGGPVPDTSYRDYSVVAGEAYSFTVKAVDRDGNESEAGPPAAVQAGVIVLQLPDVAGKPGEFVRIPVSVLNSKGIKPYGMSLDFRYPADLVSLTLDGGGNVTDGVAIERTAITARMNISIDAHEPGRVTILGIDPAGMAALVGEGHLFDVIVRLRENADSGDCGALFFPDGGATFYGETLQPLGTDAADVGALCALDDAKETEPTCTQGDLNDDGSVDSADVLMALQIAAGGIPPNACALSAGDLNGDGDLDSADALMLQRLVSDQPVNPSPTDETLATILAGVGTVTVTASQPTAYPGETVEVAVSISDAHGLSGLDLAVSYPGDLALETILSGALTASFEEQETLEPGFAQVSMMREHALGAGGGSLAVFRFRVADDVPPGTQLPVTLSSVALKGQFGDRFDWYTSVQKQDGLVQVVSATKPEDVNADHATDALDIQAVINAVLGLGVHYQCDVNGDSHTDALDVQSVINAALGL